MSVLAGLDIAIALLTRGLQISQLVSAVQAEGRSEFTKEEWDLILAANDDARTRLEKAIEARRTTTDTGE